MKNNTLWQVIAYPENGRGVIVSSEKDHETATQKAYRALDDNPHYEAVTVRRIKQEDK
ncbi:hypothetical protein KRX11_01105 [Pasteurellaceae bacterium TAE3-ERU1]|nr:hypothetical protein [Pasteurellaceae bacterium TAE3-ERU1]